MSCVLFWFCVFTKSLADTPWNKINKGMLPIGWRRELAGPEPEVVNWKRCKHLPFLPVFPKCVAKGSCFTFGVSGLGRVRSTLLLRSQPSATVRDDCVTAVPMENACKSGHCWTFETTWFRLAGVALYDIAKWLITCQKSFCLTGAILLRRFQKMTSIFCGRRTTLEMSMCSLLERCSTWTCRVACFCESHCQGCVKWWRRGNSVACVAFCDMYIMKIDGCLAWNVNLEVADFGVHQENSQENVGFVATKYQNLRQSGTKCSF